LLDLLETDPLWSPGSRTPAVNSHHLSAYYSSASDTDSVVSNCDHLVVETTESLDASEANVPGDSCSSDELVEAIQLNLIRKADIGCEQASAVALQASLDAREGSPSRVPTFDRVIPPHSVNNFLPFDLPSTVSPSRPTLSPAKARSWPRGRFSQKIKAPLSQIFKKRHSSDQL
jgi:hypothetical protein